MNPSGKILPCGTLNAASAQKAVCEGLIHIADPKSRLTAMLAVAGHHSSEKDSPWRAKGLVLLGFASLAMSPQSLPAFTTIMDLARWQHEETHLTDPVAYFAVACAIVNSLDQRGLVLPVATFLAHSGLKTALAASEKAIIPKYKREDGRPAYMSVPKDVATEEDLIQVLRAFVGHEYQRSQSTSVPKAGMKWFFSAIPLVRKDAAGTTVPMSDQEIKVFKDAQDAIMGYYSLFCGSQWQRPAALVVLASYGAAVVVQRRRPDFLFPDPIFTDGQVLEMKGFALDTGVLKKIEEEEMPKAQRLASLIRVCSRYDFVSERLVPDMDSAGVGEAIFKDFFPQTMALVCSDVPLTATRSITGQFNINMRSTYGGGAAPAGAAVGASGTTRAKKKRRRKEPPPVSMVSDFTDTPTVAAPAGTRAPPLGAAASFSEAPSLSLLFGDGLPPVFAVQTTKSSVGALVCHVPTATARQFLDLWKRASGVVRLLPAHFYVFGSTSAFITQFTRVPGTFPTPGRDNLLDQSTMGLLDLYNIWAPDNKVFMQESIYEITTLALLLAVEGRQGSRVMVSTQDMREGNTWRLALVPGVVVICGGVTEASLGDLFQATLAGLPDSMCAEMVAVARGSLEALNSFHLTSKGRLERVKALVVAA